ncbi:MAG: serine/threonine protein kinase [Planctomycetota bacterium]|nr:MAG: serine/threonine protein kinase [Planctomycetota bacterium]
MKPRIRWQFEDEEGVLPLRGGRLWAVCADGLLDSLGRPPTASEDGFSAALDDQGRIALAASGRLRFEVDGRRGRRVLLPPGGAVGFRNPDGAGRLVAEGTAAADPLVGTELGGYRILGRLGHGAVGVVYRALQTSLDREVALKVLNEEASRDPEKVASFRREAIAAGRLSHPNLVQVHDVGDDGDRHFFSMELVPGGTLEDRLREQGPLAWRDAVAAIRDAALALAFAEEHHLVHRDVKPENLMVTASGHVKLADLGLAATRGMIEGEGAGGTPHFMAPESVHPEGIGPAADLYSLGCTLFRLLTGDTVFHGDTVRDILRAHRELEPPTLREAGVEAPREVQELLSALLRKDPADRPDSAAAVAAWCDRILSHRRQRRGLGLAAAVLVLGGGGFLLWRALSPPPPAPAPAPAIAADRTAASERLEAQRAAEKAAQEAFAAAMAETDPARRAEALRAFLDAHAGHTLATAARAEIARIEAGAGDGAPPPDGAGAASPPEPPPVPPEVVRVQQEVAALLAEGRIGAAWTAVEAAAEPGAGPPLPPADLAALRARVQTAAEETLANLEAEHAALLGAGDLAAAAARRTAVAEALSDAPAAAAAWKPRLETLAAAEAEARARAARRAAAATRAAFAAAVQERIPVALRRFDPAAALAAWDEAAAGAADSEPAAAARAHRDLLARAAAAAAALRARLERGPIPVVEPIDGKRADLLALEPDGPRLQVQVRGERVERRDPWATWFEPAVLAGFLDQTLPKETDPADAAALRLVLAEAWAADLFRRLAAGAPGDPAARELADGLPRLLPPPAAEPLPPAVARERELLAGLADFAAALAAGDDYSALLRLDDLLDRFGLLTTLISRGEAGWGLSE